MRNLKDEVLIVAMVYLEPYWEQTKKCIEDTGLDVIYADREGVGSMSGAFNTRLMKFFEAKKMLDSGLPDYKYIFFVTNIAFKLSDIERLVASIEAIGERCVGIHPCHSSDHQTHQLLGGVKVNITKEVKYIEWTAPLVRMDYFEKNMLDSRFRYWFFDLVWCHEARKQRKIVCVDYDVYVQHSYLRFNEQNHPISRIRSELRWYWEKPEQETLEQIYGANWREILW